VATTLEELPGALRLRLPDHTYNAVCCEREDAPTTKTAAKLLGRILAKREESEGAAADA